MTTSKATITITMEADNTLTTEYSHAFDEGLASTVWLGMLEIAKLSVVRDIKQTQPKTSLTCAKCGVDRMHEACKQPGLTCPLMGNAQ